MHLKEGSEVWERIELKVWVAVSVVPSWWSVVVVRQAPNRFLCIIPRFFDELEN